MRLKERVNDQVIVFGNIQRLGKGKVALINPTHKNTIGRYFFVVLLLLFMTLLGSCQQQSTIGKQPIARKGILDLRQWNFEEQGIIPLDGEWSFYWSELLDPEDFGDEELPSFTGFINIPERWDVYETESGTLPGSGYATFRLHIKIKPTGKPFAIKILDMSSSYKMWINQKVVATNGIVGKNKATSKPQYLPLVTDFPIDTENNYITLQVSNFSHKKGGIWLPIEFGTKNDIQQKRIRNLAFELVLFGSLMVMSFYHFGLFVLRRTDRFTLYFALVCLIVAVRTVVVGERFFIWMFPDFNWEIFQKAEYLSLYLAVPSFYFFVSSLYSEISQRIGKLLLGFSILISLFALVTPVIIHSHAIIYYHLMMAVLGFYIPYALIKTITNRREGAILVSVGIIILSTSVFYEILSENQIIQTINLSSIGLFLFVFIQSVMLAIRFSKAFTTSEILSEELETKVEERTRGLKLAHEEIVDANKKLKETQRQLVQSQKMEAMGTLAGGIAHEFNNILGTIIGYSEMLVSEVKSGSILREGLKAIVESGNRAADLVRQILTFSRADSQELTPMIIQSEIGDILNVIRKTIPESISVEINLQENCSPIMSNKTQISQVLLNLCTNAVDAMRLHGGIITIELTEKRLTKDQLPSGFNPGTFLELSIKDTGMGMTEEVKNRIFDPFYTTKDVNEGTGLGLSIVHGIVKSHSGFIDVESFPNKGSKISVYFPVTENKILQIQEKTNIPKQGKGHILIVEDEKDLLNLYRVMLQKLGYKSTVFFDGIAALESFKSQPNQYDLVFTDQMMPKLTGFDMSLEMLRIRPEIPIIIATGHSPSVDEHEAKKFGIKYFMTKPVRLSELSQKISELI